MVNTVEVSQLNSFMAISTEVPHLNKPYWCKCIKCSGFGQCELVDTELATIDALHKFSKNVYLARTGNSCYFIKTSKKGFDKVHFAFVDERPIIGKPLAFLEVFLDKKRLGVRVKDWETINVQDCIYMSGIYKVITEKSTYICLPLV